MSEVTTLKQLMLDAARYRWLRENIGFTYDSFLDGTEKPSDIDEFIDELLDRE